MVVRVGVTAPKRSHLYLYKKVNHLILSIDQVMLSRCDPGAHAPLAPRDEFFPSP
jgi:hypothetical protein